MKLLRKLEHWWWGGLVYKSAERKYIIQSKEFPDGGGTYYRVILTDCIVPWSDEFECLEKNFRTLREAREWVEMMVEKDNNAIF